jgi:hypothetical protein
MAGAMLAACNPEADTDNAAIATDDAAIERQASAPAAGANSFTEDQARERIVAQGYTEPTALTQGQDGTWRGQALRDGQPVQITVDYQGNVTPATTQP